VGRDRSRSRIIVLAKSLDPALESLTAVADVRVCADAHAVAVGLPRADALIVWDYSLLPLLAGRWEKAARLEWIQVSGVGTDGVADAVQRRPGIILTNGGGIFEDAVAEYSVTLMLAIAKDIPGTLADQAARRWEPRATSPLRGRLALILGAGAIGRRISAILGVLGLRVQVLARTARHDSELGDIAAIDRLDEWLPEADIVVCALPASPGTTGLLSRARLGRVRAGALLVNVGRGDLIDESALVDEVIGGRIAGVGLDVFETEPLPPTHPLWTLGERAVLSPHMAGEMAGWQALVAERCMENFARWCAGDRLVGIVEPSGGAAVLSKTSPSVADR
jgi:phosphoglycerate dehydrogenase-like enzyme